MGPCTENVAFWGCNICFFGVALIQSTQFSQWYLECKRFMLLMKYFIFFATVAMITEVLPFFPISIATIVRETNSFNISPVPKCLWQSSLAGWWVTLTGLHPQSHTTLWPCGLARSRENQNHYIFTTTVPMAGRLGRTAIYLDRLPPIKLLDL